MLVRGLNIHSILSLGSLEDPNCNKYFLICGHDRKSLLLKFRYAMELKEIF